MFFSHGRRRPDRPRLGLERLEARDTPAYLTTPGANLAIGNVIGTIPPTEIDPRTGQIVGNPPNDNALAVDELVFGTGAGGGPVVTVYNQAGQLLTTFYAYDPSFRNGVAVATGDVNGDGIDEIITAPGPGGGPNVKVFTAGGQVLASFFAYDAGFRGGVSVAAGDITGDGKAEIVTGPGVGGGPLVRYFNAAGKLQNTLLVLDTTFRGGVNVAVGDVNLATPASEIIAGAGVGGSPLVQAFTRTGVRVGGFYAFDPGDRTGVSVASGDTDFGGADEIWAYRGPGVRSEVRGFAVDGTVLSKFDPYENLSDPYLGGVNLAIGDGNADRIDDVVTVRATGDYLQAPAVFVGQLNLVPQGLNPTFNPGVYAADNNWTYYFPIGFTTARRFPILFAFDPAGNIQDPSVGAYNQQLKQAADRLGFVVVTSRYYRSFANGGPTDGKSFAFTSEADGTDPTFGNAYPVLRKQIQDVLDLITNSDQTRIVLAGYGEGGSIAHALNFYDPELADGILADQGPVYGAKVLDPGDPTSTGQYGPEFYRYAIENAGVLALQQTLADSRKVYRFITTDQDPLRDEVLRDNNLLYSAAGLGYSGNTTILAGVPAGQPAPTYLPELTALFNEPTWINPP